MEMKLIKLVIKDHCFEPTELSIAADKRVKLIINNQDGTVEEFESKASRVEKLIPDDANARIWVGLLKSGTYTFAGEFHEDTAQGILISE